MWAQAVHRAFAFLTATALAFGIANDSAAQKGLGVESFIYVGTRTGGHTEAQGIYLFRMRTSDDPNVPEFVTVTPLGLVAEAICPTYFEIEPHRKLLFSLEESGTGDSKESGMICAFSIDSKSGRLTLINRVTSRGRGPCHLALDQEGKYLLAVNANSGGVTVLPVEDDGKLGAATDVEAHADPNHQSTPRPSGVAFSPDNRFAWVCDAGLDGIVAYKFDAESGELTPHEPAFTPTKQGAGPRRIVFHPNGKFAYVVNERNSTITAFAYDSEAGTLRELQTLSTVPEYYDGPNAAVEIGLHPSGKNLLVSNCGHESVVLFTINDRDGTLTYVEDQSTYGKTPRHFSFDGDGKHVVVANEQSGSILILRAPENARVKPGGNVTPTPSPTCAKFLPR